MTLLKILSGVFFGTFTLVFLGEAAARQLASIDFVSLVQMIPEPFRDALGISLLVTGFALAIIGIAYIVSWMDGEPLW